MQRELHGALPLLPTINLNAATYSLLPNIVRLPDVLLVVNDAPPDSWGCTLSSSNRTSKAPIDVHLVFLSFINRVRGMVHPALFWSLFDAKRSPALLWRPICCGGRSVLECDLYSFVEENETVPRQT